MAKKNRRRKVNGDCWLCGDPADSAHGLDSKCYSTVRFWSANRTVKERHAYETKLDIRMKRMRALDDGLIKINHLKEPPR